ncbi:HAMP domain-containing sensor histidine kinase [Roseibacillus ishigakijimensis]|uniref:histidine kinase n=1 Tax=Roseibacillus ishigakijimensis TaxID=454146 RepID=A0A934VLG7_9BACT|nr:ATP-binding protein [Roseibacillus ishigakijimensis]MBK1833086.1 HAMP domain-containing protein [Roseibacillus ishigakijimensis]
MKRKILFGNSVFLLLLFGTGGGAMWLLDQTSDAFIQSSVKFQDQSRAIQDLRFGTSSINTHYLPAMVVSDSELPPIPPREHFENSFASMMESLTLIRATADEPERQSLERLKSALDKYGQRYQELFAYQPEDFSARMQARNEIAHLTQQVSDLSLNEFLWLDERFGLRNEELRRETLQSNWLLGGLLVLGVIASTVFYFQANRVIIDPLLNLIASVKEIRRGNFELTLPVRNSTDEIAQLIPAFNEMASELRLMRRTNDEQLLRFDRQSRAILASFPHPIILLSKEGQIEKLNPSAEALFENLGTLGVLPRNISERIAHAVDHNEELLVERLDEALLLRINETEHFFLPRIFRLTESQQGLEGWALLLIDVTRLRFFDDLKSNLISTVSHEIKTPLTGIRMVLHLLLEKKIGDLNETQDEMLTSAQNDCERLLETLRNLLEMSRMDSGARSLTREEISPATLYESVLTTFTPQAAEREVTLQLELEDGVPDVLVDRIRIIEVLNNFVSNAIKHSPPGGTVTLTAKALGADDVRFGVYDEGAGVPEESRNRIFERFYRAPDQSQIEGIGLGLSIAREIVNAHEGRIGYRRTKDNRTLFFCNLPRV